MPNPHPDEAPLVSVVMPVRNEAAHLTHAFSALDAQTYPRHRIEVLVVDGGSTDTTLEVVQRQGATDPRIRLLGGAGVNTPAAMNVGLAAAHGDIIAKVDGHGWVNPGFLSVAQRALSADPTIGCVGGIIEPVASTPTERAISIARFSVLGVGGGVYTLDKRIQDVETVQCGVYRRAALEEVGGFDPLMAFGEDEEVNFRIRMAGWRIQLQPEMRFAYQVRPSIRALARQYFRYGRARVAVVRKHPAFLRPKHLAPTMLVLVLAAAAALLLISGARVAGALVFGTYFATLMAGALSLCVRARFARFDLVAASLAALHLGYGLGLLRGSMDAHPSSDDPATNLSRGP